MYIRNKNSGFSLIELSIVVLVVGIMLTLYLNIYKVWQESKNFYAVETNLDNALQAVTFFYNEYNRYPCPADQTLNRDDANFGVEDCSVTSVTGANTALDPANNNILIGNLPLIGRVDDGSGTIVSVTLSSLVPNIKSEGTSLEDPWNDPYLFTYAVSESLTDRATFADQNGAIRLQDESGQNTGGTNNNAHFVILSRGDNNNCVGRGPAETENCDDDAIFVSGLYQESSTVADYFDDFIRFRRSSSDNIWQMVENNFVYNDDPDSTTYIGDEDGYVPPIGSNIRLAVRGDLSSENSVASDVICDDEGRTNCVEPETLYDLSCPKEADPDLGTPPDPATHVYITAVKRVGTRLVAECGPLTLPMPADISGNCAGKYIRGIYSNGKGPDSNDDGTPDEDDSGDSKGVICG